MSETNQTTGGTIPTTSDPVPDHSRWWVFSGLWLVCLAVIAGLEYRSLQQVARLERALAEARPTSFLVGLRLREGLEQSSASLLRFQLSGDPSERNRFQATTQELSDRLARARYSLITQEERDLAQQAAQSLRGFLTDVAPLLSDSRRTIRRDTAEEVHQEIRAKIAPLLQIADRLVAVQETSAAEFLSGAQQGLGSLRSWLLGSLVMFVLLLGIVAALSFRALVTPLRLRLSESQAIIERQERLASLGVLTAGVAHEIRNPLAAIKFRLYSLRRSLSASAIDNEDLTVIDGEIQRLDRILKDFLQFARPSDPDFQPMAITQLFKGIQDLLQAELGRRGLRLEISPGQDLTVRADHQQMQQVLINLIQNAAEAMKSGGVITLSARAGAARRARRVEPVVMVDVADSGKGLAPEIGQKIFDPFFSTKEGGTGLGLPMAARIVELHGGVLQYTSQVDRGSTFTVVLPRGNHEAA